MKQLSKMMLAAVASVAIAAPAFAWDFTASGSGTAYFNSTSTTASTGANTSSSGGVSSEGASLKLASSHTDGDKSLSLSYTLDYDEQLDETITLSGSEKIGAWTASSSVSYARDSYGCYATDNASTAKTSCGTTGASQSSEDSTSVTVTDGTLTITFGEAGHLSNQNVSAGSTAAGAVSFDAADDDISVGAFVDDFHGVSVGYKISDTMSATFAYQASGESADMMGSGEFYDGETNTTHSTAGPGIGFSGTFGPATVGLTVASAATADGSGAGASTSTKSSHMGLGVAIDLGAIDPFISYGSYSAKGSVTETGVAYTGNEIGLTYALGAGSDTIVVYVGSVTETTTTTGTEGEPLVISGMEVGYNTKVGPATLKVGYGSQTKAQTGGSSDGYSMSDIEVAMSFSF